MFETLHDLLQQEGVEYELHEHDRAVDANRLAQAEDVSGWRVAKPVVLNIAGELAMAVIPAAMRIDLDKAEATFGRNAVVLAEEDDFAEWFPDAEAGAEAPFGNLYGMPVFVDASLRDQPRIVCRDGSHTRTIRLAMDDYLRVVDPEIVDITERQ